MLAVAILAAGKGTRMKSNLPKVLQRLGGSTLVQRILSSVEKIKPDRIFLIVGHQAELIRESIKGFKHVEFIEQKPQMGTGHAIQQLLPVLENFEGELLVLNGDVPLLRDKTMKELINSHRKYSSGVTFLTATIDNPIGYGRVIADDTGLVSSIVEEQDCNKDQQQCKLINAGVYCFNWAKLEKILPDLSNNNKQNEIYLTDTVSMFDSARHIEVIDKGEVTGINDRQQLAKCETLHQKRLRNYWMSQGVSFIDEKSCTISDCSRFGKDVVIEPQTHIRGHCNIGDGCIIGPGSLIDNSEIGSNVSVIFSVVSHSKIGNNVQIGPYSHLRPEAEISSKCKIGNFVEVKKSIIGEGSKISHLSYIGDSEIGQKVNVGAGTITANFDGFRKHRTFVGDNSRIGANSVLVAPIVIGTDVTIAAGSSITKDVADNSLAIGRSRQLIKVGWIHPATKTKIQSN